MTTLLKRLLLSVGITTFVEYYEVFEANRSGDSCEEIKKALRAKGIWKEGSIATKASCGKRIFKMNMETDAIEYIVCEAANRVEKSVLKKACRIFLADEEIDLILKELEDL
jgi:hypothetical protein